MEDVAAKLLAYAPPDVREAAAWLEQNGFVRTYAAPDGFRDAWVVYYRDGDRAAFHREGEYWTLLLLPTGWRGGREAGWPLETLHRVSGASGVLGRWIDALPSVLSWASESPEREALVATSRP